MDLNDSQQKATDPSVASPDEDTLASRKEWQEPKLSFVEPVLTAHGDLTEVTGQFFGAFSPV